MQEHLEKCVFVFEGWLTLGMLQTGDGTICLAVDSTIPEKICNINHPKRAALSLCPFPAPGPGGIVCAHTSFLNHILRILTDHIN